MAIDVTLPKLSEDEAYSAIVTYLRTIATAGSRMELGEVIRAYLDEIRPAHTLGAMKFDSRTNAEPFIVAAWRLSRHGIIAPASTYIELKYTNYVEAGNKFIVTEYGAEWIKGLSDYDTPPNEYGHFSQLLARHDSKLGKGYQARSQEALRSYRSQNYLACCAMCGAAAESITLALAIAKKGNEQEMLKMYGSSGGRSKIENFLIANQDGHITRNLPNYTTLLNDWRDISAHGDTPIVGEEEAFTALLLLLRYAKFAEERWDRIVSTTT